MPGDWNIISLLEEIAASRKNAKSSLAAYLLSYEGDFLEIKTEDIAREIHSSNAVCTRLAKDLGLRGFQELKYILNNVKSQSKLLMSIKNSSIESYIFEVETSLRDAIASIEYDSIILSGFLIHKAKCVYVFADAELDDYVGIICKLLQEVGIIVQTYNNISYGRKVLKNIRKDDFVIVMKFNSFLVDYNEYIDFLNVRLQNTLVISNARVKKPKKGIFLTLSSKTDVEQILCISNKIYLLSLFDLIRNEILKNRV